MKVILVVVLAICATCVFAQGPQVGRTGNAPTTFGSLGGYSSIDNGNYNDALDVGIPDQITATESGWDVKEIFLWYSPNADVMQFGADFYGVCGDADGDGNPNSASAGLLSLSGTDEANLGGTETLAWIVDVDENNGKQGEFVIGVPGNQGDPAQCGVDTNFIDCFGLYEYNDFAALPVPFRFVMGSRQQQADGGAYAVANNPSLGQPDYEADINLWSTLHASQGPGAQGQTFFFGWGFFAGSLNDAGIGEEYVNLEVFEIVTFDCLAGRDACGICGGSGTNECDSCVGFTDCRDCADVVFGTSTEDDCGVCGGSGRNLCLSCSGDVSCLDCDGVPFGDADYCICPFEGYKGRTAGEIDRLLLRYNLLHTYNLLDELEHNLGCTVDGLFAYKNNMDLGFCDYIDTIEEFHNQCLWPYRNAVTSFMNGIAAFTDLF